MPMSRGRFIARLLALIAIGFVIVITLLYVR
jgi:hypothetical protein